MTGEQFEEIFNKRIDFVRKLMIEKAKEYANDELVDDRLSNFKSTAQFDKTTVERACWGMWLKHITSIRDMVHSVEKLDQLPTLEKLEEKVTDNIIYAILMEAILTENITNKTNEIKG